MAASLFLVTNAGNAAAAASSPQGPYVHIVAFKLGSDATTPPQVTDTGLAGTTVYTGGVASYSYFDATTIQVNLEVPSSAGPFDYGEIGVYLPGDVLFARMSYGALRTKADSLSSGYSNTLHFKVLIRLVQGVSVFNFDDGTDQSVLEAASLQIIQTPNDNPLNPVIIVHEPNDFQQSILLFKHSATLWDIANFTKIGTTVVSSAADSTHLSAPLFSSLYIPVNNLGKYLIQTAGGYLRTVSGVSGTTATLASSIDTASLVGQTISVYESNAARIGDIAAAFAALPTPWHVGAIEAYYGTTPPPGWVELNGGLASRTTFALLYNHALTQGGGLVSEGTWAASAWTRFGAGDGSTTFRLPDFRSEFLRGWDHGRNLDAGRVLGSFQDGDNAPHTHAFWANVGGTSSHANQILVSNPPGPQGDELLVTGTNYIQNQGSEARPRNAAIMWIMRAGPETLPAGPAASTVSPSPAPSPSPSPVGSPSPSPTPTPVGSPAPVGSPVGSPVGVEVGGK